MHIREKDIEAKLREKAKLRGGKAYKFVSPGNSGVPDRIVVLPGGKIGFVELKKPGGKVSMLQKRQIRYLRELGFLVWVIDSVDLIDAFLIILENRGG